MNLRPFLAGVIALSLMGSGCVPRWTVAEGVVDLPALSPLNPMDQTGTQGETPPIASQAAASSRHLSLLLPRGWNYVMRGDDLVASREGMFLQQIHVERISIHHTDQSDGAFPYAALSSKQWPVRTGRYLTASLEAGMSPLEVAGAVAASRKNNKGIFDVDIKEMIPWTLAGNPGFRAVLDFSVAVPPNTPYGVPVPGRERKTPYRSVCYGFLNDEWLYVISYTGAKRYYFDRDAERFEEVVRGLTIR